MVARWTQGLVHEASWEPPAAWAPSRLQLYVDDPALVAWGSAAQRAMSFALALLLWMVLGLPLSWKKGAVHAAGAIHVWIGVCFTSPSPGVARMSLPQVFVDGLIRLCLDFLAKGRLPISMADALVGKAGRVAYVLPHTRPFVHTLYAALAASMRAKAVKSREAPPREVACQRFRFGASMLLRILRFRDRKAPVPHSRDVLARPPPPGSDHPAHRG